MKLLLVLSTLMLVTLFSYCQSDTTLPIKIELKLIKADTITVSKKHWEEEIKTGMIQVNSDSVKLKTFDVEVTIKNTSQDSIIIWLMSCGWDYDFEINNDYMDIRPWICDANSPYPCEFKGEETKTFKATLEKSIKFDYPCQYCIYGHQELTTKLGLIVIKTFNYRSMLNVLTYNVFEPMDKSTWRIVWSNPLYLFGEQTKPKTFPVYRN